MTDRPILFSGPMVRSILNGTKSQTRRLATRIPWRTGANQSFSHARAFSNAGEFRIAGADELTTGFRCRYGTTGDRLWVRETTVRVEEHGYTGPVYAASDNGQAIIDWGLAPGPDDVTEVEPHEIRLRPAIHMPRAMCRLVLEVVDVRIERLHAINEADALAEGIHRVDIGDGYPPKYGAAPFSWAEAVEGQANCHDDPRAAFRDLWTAINGHDSWAGNPWVWVIKFRPIDAGDQR